MKAYRNKKVLVMGLGVHGGGVGVAKFFAKQGARVTVTDLKTKKDLTPSIRALNGLPIRYVLGRHQAEDFRRADLVIKNPGVPDESPFLKIARKANVPVRMEMDIFFAQAPCKFIGVTGTKGKTTTTTLIGEILKMRFGQRLHVVGLPGKPALERLEKLRPDDIAVVELSSWQLEGLRKLKKSPHIAVVTIIRPDHINRHGTFEEYAKAKRTIVEFQRRGDVAILNREDPLVWGFRNHTKARVVGVRTSEGARFRTPKLLGKHFLLSVALAVRVAKEFDVPLEKIRKALEKFPGVPHRLEIVRVKHGVTYANDTTATQPDAAIAALKAFEKKRLVLLAGGADKELEFEEFVQAIKRAHLRALILFAGTATEKLKPMLAGLAVPIHEVHSMREAVTIAKGLARRGDVVLLSPGAASFGIFQHEFDRGEQFRRFVKAKSV